jgi:hypothetical protein
VCPRGDAPYAAIYPLPQGARPDLRQIAIGLGEVNEIQVPSPVGDPPIGRPQNPVELLELGAEAAGIEPDLQVADADQLARAIERQVAFDALVRVVHPVHGRSHLRVEVAAHRGLHLTAAVDQVLAQAASLRDGDSS